MRQKAYSPQTVIRAQRRVLKMVGNLIGRMNPRELRALRTDGKGLWTLNEAHEHIVGVVNLKVKTR